MNFLSHFYFDRYSDNPERVMGLVLPDLLKNACKDWSPRPEKFESFYTDNPVHNIYSGWKRHILVDKYFHCSDFFLHHTKNIRIAISPFLKTSPAKPFFIAHIALELMLDSLLLTEVKIDTALFYSHLNHVDKIALNNFLEINKINDQTIFYSFLEKFIEAQYLESYRDPERITYALNNICKRLWDNPFTEVQKLQLTGVVINYLEKFKGDLTGIFGEIERRLDVV